MDSIKFDVQGKLEADILNTHKSNTMLNAFRTAVNGSLTQFNMVDGIADEYLAEDGIESDSSLLLMHFDGNNACKEVVDDGNTGHVITQVATATLSKAQKQFSNTALFLDGNSDLLTIPDSADWDVVANNADDWTIDMWVNPSSLIDPGPGENAFILQEEDSTHFWVLSYTAGLRFKAFDGSSFVDTGFASSLNTNEWQHVAVCKVGSDYGVYINGIQVGHDNSATVATFAGILKIGSRGSGDFFHGYMDEVRIQKSNYFTAAPDAGLTDTITVPSAEYTSDTNTKILLHMNSNDSSTHAHIPTFVGTAKLDTTQKQFGTASLLLDGNSDSVIIPDSPDWDVVGDITEDYTIDFWVKHTLDAVNFDEYYITQRQGNDDRWLIVLASANTGIQFFVESTADGTFINTGQVGSIPDTDWHHIAVCKKGGTNIAEYGVYLDGVQISYDSSAISAVFDASLYIGQRGDGAVAQFVSGNMDEIRIQKSNIFLANPNVSLTDTITVPTAAHAIQNESVNILFDSANDLVKSNNGDIKLLLHLDGNDGDTTTTDTSPNAHTVTFNGDAQIFEPPIGNGAVKLNGTNQYLTAPNSTDWDLTGDFTIDMWVRRNSIGTNQNLLQRRDGPAVGEIQIIFVTSNDLIFDTNDGTVVRPIVTGQTAIDIWVHYAFVRVGQDMAIYKNGTQVAFDTGTVQDLSGSSAMTIGAAVGGALPVDGYLDEVRITNNNAFSATPVVGLTDTITVPTSEHTSDANTKLLLHLDSNFTDSGDTGHTITAVNSPIIVDKKYDTMIFFDGSGDYLTVPDSEDWDVTENAIDDWTVDFWFKFIEPNPAGDMSFITHHEDINNRWVIRYNGGWQFFLVSGVVVISSGAATPIITDTNWHHFAMCKVADEYSIYIDGEQEAYVQDSSTDTFTGSLFIGQRGNNSDYFRGFGDEIRIVKDNIFNANPVSGLTGTIAVPNSAKDLNISLIAKDFIAQAQPNTARIVLLEEDIGTIINNTDLIVSVSRDGGTTYSPVTLADEGAYLGDVRILVGEADISSQPAGTTMKYKIETVNQKEIKAYATGLSWD